tara:strand:+ start:21343 stop:21816 length:474 start_codon:yes stop_codon:yes gene_type:complete
MTEQKIKNIVEEYYSIQITRQIRKRNYVEARAMYFSLCRKYTRLSLEAIGKTVGRHHASVLHCVQQLELWRKYDARVRADYEYLYNKAELIKKNDAGKKVNNIEEALLNNHILRTQLEDTKQRNLNLSIELKDLTFKYLQQKNDAEKYYQKKWGITL